MNKSLLSLALIVLLFVSGFAQIQGSQEDLKDIVDSILVVEGEEGERHYAEGLFYGVLSYEAEGEDTHMYEFDFEGEVSMDGTLNIGQMQYDYEQDLKGKGNLEVMHTLEGMKLNLGTGIELSGLLESELDFDLELETVGSQVQVNVVLKYQGEVVFRLNEQADLKEDKEIAIGEEMVIYEGEEYDSLLTVYWCGFSEEFCGQSSDDDVFDEATHVILAFLNIESDGSVVDGEMPTDLIEQWQQSGKQVLISVGGRSGSWDDVFQSDETYNNFVTTLMDIIEQNNLDGVDIMVQTFTAPPQDLLQLLEQVRSNLPDGKKIMVSIPNVAVYPSDVVPQQELDDGEQSWNYFLPIIKENSDVYDYVQVQIFQNDYWGTRSSEYEGEESDFVIYNVLGWMNRLEQYQIEDFDGIEAQKLIISTAGSQDASMLQSQYFVQPSDLSEALEFLEEEDIRIAGVNIWNSFYDEQNNNEISQAVYDSLIQPREEEYKASMTILRPGVIADISGMINRSLVFVALALLAILA